MTQPTDPTTSPAPPPADPAPATHLVVVIDASGSMSSRRGDVIEDTNKLLADIDPSVRVTIVQFDSRDPQVVTVDNVPAGEVTSLTAEDYEPNAGTPLYDAVGIAIGSTVGKVREYEVLTGNTPQVVFAIISDGEENSSERYTAEDVRRLIERHQKEGWTVQFLGLGIDAFAEGARLGVRRENTLSSTHDRLGTAANFLAVTRSVRGLPIDFDSQEQS